MPLALRSSGGVWAAETPAADNASQRAGVAARAEPVVVASLASYEKLFDAANHVGKRVGNPELASGGKDRIELMLGPIEHGTRVHFEVMEGVVKSLAGLRSPAETR